jgi:hypothetical protein
MKRTVLPLLMAAATALAHNSYTGGYSSAPGSSGRCASSCHGGTSGTLVVIGFPASYQPMQTYRITITHNGGNRIVNFNATTRVGTSTTVAGTFSALTNSLRYTGADGGVYANPHLIDTATFNWTAPATGTGTVTLYAAAFQGTSTNSSSGQSGRVTLSATENTTGVQEPAFLPLNVALDQNSPNPFNPSTEIRFALPRAAFATLTVFNLLGQEITTLVKGDLPAGQHRVLFTASGLPSGIYFYRLETSDIVQTRKMILTR